LSRYLFKYCFVKGFAHFFAFGGFFVKNEDTCDGDEGTQYRQISPRHKKAVRSLAPVATDEERQLDKDDCFPN
jgi:hypothetical protein